MYITKSQWMWYENWIPVIERYCEKISKQDSSNDQIKLYATDIVKIMNEKGYVKFSTFWLESLWKYKLKIDRSRTQYGYFDRNKRFVWRKEWIDVVDEFCQGNAYKFGKQQDK